MIMSISEKKYEINERFLSDISLLSDFAAIASDKSKLDNLVDTHKKGIAIRMKVVADQVKRHILHIMGEDYEDKVVGRRLDELMESESWMVVDWSY